MKKVLFLIALTALLASCGTSNKCRKAEKNWGKYRYGMNIELIDGNYWMVDNNANRVLINDPAKVEQEIAEYGFDVVFNHYAGISSGNDPLAPKVSLPIRSVILEREGQ